MLLTNGNDTKVFGRHKKEVPIQRMMVAMVVMVTTATCQYPWCSETIAGKIIFIEQGECDWHNQVLNAERSYHALQPRMDL